MHNPPTLLPSTWGVRNGKQKNPLSQWKSKSECMQALLWMPNHTGSPTESFQEGWTTEKMLHPFSSQAWSGVAIRHWDNSEGFALGAHSGCSWQANHKYGKEAQYGSNTICYLIVCNPEGRSRWVMTHRGKIKYNNIMFILCSRLYYFWHHGGRQLDCLWSLPGSAQRVRGAEETSLLWGKWW